MNKIFVINKERNTTKVFYSAHDCALQMWGELKPDLLFVIVKDDGTILLLPGTFIPGDVLKLEKMLDEMLEA